ncbi:hypothetical protein EON65_01190 [archaeon]|nr:MAG: hypothetical protein EON65_01190 [archaeon]
MNSFGFVLDLPGPTTQGGGSTSSINTVPGLDGPIFEVKQLSDPSSDADAILERYGLTKKLIDKFNGQLVIDNLRSILLSIEDEGLALNIRIALSEGLLLWHRTISEDVTQSALNTVYYKIIEMIRFILADPDGSNLTSTAQRAAYNMSLVLNRQVISTPAFRQTVYADVLRALQYVVDQNIVLSELCPEEDAPHIRCTSLRLLLQCLPVEGTNSSHSVYNSPPFPLHTHFTSV